MTTHEALAKAREMLGGAATEDAIVDQAALLMMQEIAPEEEARLVRAEAERLAFEAILAHARDFTEAQIAALELTDEQATRMAEARRRKP
jgi:hypothetical protein